MSKRSYANINRAITYTIADAEIDYPHMTRHEQWTVVHKFNEMNISPPAERITLIPRTARNRRYRLRDLLDNPRGKS